MEALQSFSHWILWIVFSYVIVVLYSFPFNLPLLLIVFRYLWHDGDEKAARYPKSWLLIKVYSICFVFWRLIEIVRVMD